MGTQLPSTKRGRSPLHNFRPMSVVGKRLDGSRWYLVWSGPWSNRPQIPSPKRGQSPQFLAYVYCGQTAGWTKMSLGTEVGLSPNDIVLHGDPATPQKRAWPPIFRPCLLRPNSCVYQDTTWYGGRPQLRWHCVRWDPGPPPLRGTPPNFRPMSVVAKWLDGLRCHFVWRFTSVQVTFCSMGTQLPPEKMGTAPAPNFCCMSIVAKRLDGSRCHLVWR